MASTHHLLRLLLATILSLFTLFPTLSVSSPVPAGGSGELCGAVWAEHWHRGEAQRLFLGCNYLSDSGLTGKVSSFLVLQGYRCYFYPTSDCTGGELWYAESRSDATLRGHHDDAAYSVHCGRR